MNLFSLDNFITKEEVENLSKDELEERVKQMAQEIADYLNKGKQKDV